MLGTQPRILAVGEAHAPQGSEAVLSATSRFAHALLPLLRGRMSDLVLELAVADGSCGARERQVAAAQKPVTARQASTNQDELVALRRRATELGARAHLLRPSCADYAEVARAGPDAIPRMLELVARLTATRVRALLSAAPSSSDRMVVTYGGAMHNDLVPRPGREKWSFGPERSARTSGRYVELDLVVPEYVRDNDSWRALEWYPYFSPAAHPGKTLLFNPRPGSYVLIFPRDGVQR
ncbi:MAG: hypothetical protein HY744_03935 [Deltaproteobacteria bacterium]|nr:hypothetical protein [Deltaproteobacteria bacterium]